MLFTQHFSFKRKYYITVVFIFIFLATLINNVPTWVLGNAINHYSQGKLKLYNQTGTFWQGSGLLVAVEPKIQQSAPLLLLNWKITLGLTKFVTVKFSIANTPIATAYLNKQGANLDNLNLSLSISQVSQLSDIVKDLGLSGDLTLSTNHLLLGKKTQGMFEVELANVSSSISPVNPLGTYQITLDASNGTINVMSNGNSTLILKGNGNLNGLTLNARIDEAKKQQMMQFLTVMGIPQADGSYQLKLF